MHFQAEIGSTNSWLKQQFELGNVRRPALVLTDRQTAGRGTRGRDWLQSGRDLALTAGQVMPAGIEIDQRFSLAVGAVCAVAIETVSGLSTKVKWPNDVLTGPTAKTDDWRKVCGILIETVIRRGEKLLVVGTGINVDSSATSYPAPLSGKLTTLRDALGESPERPKLARHLAVALLDLLESMCNADAVTREVNKLVTAWFARDATAGCRYILHRGEEPLPVTALRVDRQSCGLVVADERRCEYLVTAYTELTAADESG